MTDCDPPRCLLGLGFQGRHRLLGAVLGLLGSWQAPLHNDPVAKALSAACQMRSGLLLLLGHLHCPILSAHFSSTLGSYQHDHLEAKLLCHRLPEINESRTTLSGHSHEFQTMLTGGSSFSFGTLQRLDKSHHIVVSGIHAHCTALLSAVC